MIGLASAFIGLFKSEKFDKRIGIFENGDDNLYPEMVESRILESVTARRCVETMTTYLAGKGFGDEINKIIVNKKKDISLLHLLQDIAESISEHEGFFVHMNYNDALEHTSFEVLPFSHCRIGMKDDDQYSAKIHVCTDWSDDKKAKKAKKVDVYNTDDTVLRAQINAAKGIKKYNGQILYFKFGKYIYPYSRLHPVRHDADSEKNASLFKSSSLKKGFFGKTVVITKPLVDPTLPEDDPEYVKQYNGRKAFRDTLGQFIGAENNDGIMHVEMQFESDDIEKEVVFKNVETNLNDKLFEHTESSCSENICIAFGINPNLIRPTNTGLFSQSGEAFTQMKLDYQEDTENYRMIIEQVVNKLMSKFTDPMEKLSIIPRIEITKDDVTTDQ